MRLQLSDFIFQEKYPVHWGELDAAKHVNNLVYLKWTETLRVNFCDHLGIDTSFDAGTVGIILGAQYCKYIYPMRFPDTAIVGLKIQSIEPDRFTVLSGIFSEKHQRIAAWSTHDVIAYDYGALNKVDLPEEWKKQLSNYT